jgi:hypothetical protein
VLSVAAGTGISLSGSATNPTINATGVPFTQSFTNLQPGSIPSATLTGALNPKTALFTFFALGGSANIPTVAGGIYALQGQFNVNASGGVPCNIEIFLNNANQDVYILDSNALDYDQSTPTAGVFANQNIPFCIMFYATGSFVNMVLGIGPNSTGCTLNGSLAPCTLTRLA